MKAHKVGNIFGHVNLELSDYLHSVISKAKIEQKVESCHSACNIFL